MNNLQVVAWKWLDVTNRVTQRSPYTAEKVNRWGRMIRDNLRMPHDLVCITDDPSGIDSSIRIIPLWDDLKGMGRCWRRLKAFSPDMREVIGPRWVWTDLDSVVTGDLTPLFQRTEDIVFWAPKTTRTPYNGSMVLQSSGCRAQVWEKFSLAKALRDVNRAQYTGSDQAWWSCVLGPSEAVWKPDPDGVCAYWHHCRAGPPAHCRVVYFPGQLKDNGDYVRRTSPWVAEYLDRAKPLAEPEYGWERGRRVIGAAAPQVRRGYARRSFGRAVVGGGEVV
jgi:hypothetical protein